jgi:hypothetical protein
MVTAAGANTTIIGTATVTTIIVSASMSENTTATSNVS